MMKPIVVAILTVAQLYLSATSAFALTLKDCLTRAAVANSQLKHLPMMSKWPPKLSEWPRAVTCHGWTCRRGTRHSRLPRL
ncbi:hypothetical protein [Geotalea toluenoxydans]|uniref:hypothetical protein n=1 Tax=Geotalea toluenoxydans TaxID=421624 RepID=UPI000AA34326|nr:hypothetical protein [Geotalea toluenoxydans]